MRFVLALIVLILIGTGAWYFMATPSEESQTETENVAATGTENDVVVTKTDITQGGVSKLPVGFPREIPVEVANITESYRAVYAEHGVVQYTVSYTSQKSRDALWTAYSDYMRDAGYTVDTGASSKSAGQINGAKGDDTFSAVISSHNGISLAQLNLLDRGQ